MQIDDVSTILEEENISLSNVVLGKYLNVCREAFTMKRNVTKRFSPIYP